MTAIIWSKEKCPYCDQAKMMLKRSGIAFDVYDITGNDEMRNQLIGILDEVAPGAPKTVPQIWLHGEYVGDYTALMKYYEDHNMYSGNQGL